MAAFKDLGQVVSSPKFREGQITVKDGEAILRAQRLVWEAMEANDG